MRVLDDVKLFLDVIRAQLTCLSVYDLMRQVLYLWCNLSSRLVCRICRGFNTRTPYIMSSRCLGPLSKLPQCCGRHSGLRSFSSSIKRAASYEEDTIANLRIDRNTRVIYQGLSSLLRIVRGFLTIITHKATINAKDTLAYGTNVVGGVSPGKGGKDHLGLPVFDTVRQVMPPSLS